MKISKKFLLIGLFSFLFCFNVNADEVLYSKYYSELKYDESVKEKINNNKERYDNLIEYISTYMAFVVPSCSISEKNCLVSIDMSTIDSDIWLISFDRLLPNNDSPFIYNTYRIKYNLSRNLSLRFSFFSYYVTFNSDNEIVEYVKYQSGTHIYQFSYDSLKPFENDVVLLNSTYYFITKFMSETITIPFKFGGADFSDFYQIPLKINNEIYTPETEIYLYDLLNNMMWEENQENTCSRSSVLGTVSNVNDITLNVKGDTSALAEPLKGTFTLNYSDYSDILRSDDFVIEVIDNNNIGIVGNYNFKCSEDSYNCYLNYEYITNDDIEESVSISFKIIPLNNGFTNIFVKIYACTTNNDYSGISYDYTNGSTDSTITNPSLDNYLNDNTPPSSDISSLGNVQGILPEGPVDGLLNIPFKVLSILINSFNGVCTPLTITFVFDSVITFPCFDDLVYSNLPEILMLFINIVPSAFILTIYFKNLYKRVDRALSLETSADDEWGGI